MKKLILSTVLTALVALPLAATPLILENYEGLAPGSPEPNFPGINSNHPSAEIGVAAETAGQELFYPGNTRYFRWFSLSGQNPDPAGSSNQYHGGPTQFIPFGSGNAQVVSVGFDFIVGPLHSELLFGIGEPPTDRVDDQNYAVQLRFRGVLGLGNRPEVVGSGVNREFRADIQQDVPYRLEFVANKSGGPVTYESPLGTMTVGNERYDIYLYNYHTEVLQLLISDVEWKFFDSPGPPATRAMEMQGIWWGTFRYDATGRSVDFKMNDVAVYENEIVLTGHDSVPPGPATAIIDFEDDSPANDIVSPLWNLPGNIVADSGGIFGSQNQNYFHIDRRLIPDGMSDRFRFNGDASLLSIGFDMVVVADPSIQTFSDGHDEGFIALTGGDTATNDRLTVRINIRGTRTNTENPAESLPSINVVGDAGSVHFRNGMEWNKPYRMEIVLNQTGETITYNTPWAQNVTLENEWIHVYLYNYETGMNVAEELGRSNPFVIEASFLNGLFNASDVAGTMSDIFWKHTTGRRQDLKLDNIVIYQDAAVVTNPSATVSSAPRILASSFEMGSARDFQTETRNRYSLTFESEVGMTYGVSRSEQLGTFELLKTIVPADATQAFTTVEFSLSGDRRFYRIHPIHRQ